MDPVNHNRTAADISALRNWNKNGRADCRMGQRPMLVLTRSVRYAM
jgi:hypothetical protein